MNHYVLYQISQLPLSKSSSSKVQALSGSTNATRNTSSGLLNYCHGLAEACQGSLSLIVNVLLHVVTWNTGPNIDSAMSRGILTHSPGNVLNASHNVNNSFNETCARLLHTRRWLLTYHRLGISVTYWHLWGSWRKPRNQRMERIWNATQTAPWAQDRTRKDGAVQLPAAPLSCPMQVQWIFNIKHESHQH